ncbi:hypothetical protein GCM10007971_22070 [Oceanobacillus indicireducens]|uniref:Uncharacterized protein n=1 Tax=Oceanobacillus indicireducens TaxID=1004261 RepID=A0A917Y073_9BACI|nr:hypothetical protein GCM10007971_22070 [Oceanobacillus indicireducens]
MKEGTGFIFKSDFNYEIQLFLHYTANYKIQILIFKVIGGKSKDIYTINVKKEKMVVNNG